MSKIITSILATALLALATAGTATAASGACLRVIVVKTDNVTNYLHELDKARDDVQAARRGGADPRLSRDLCRHGHRRAGGHHRVSELPGDGRGAGEAGADKEFSSWMASLEKMRTITSDSIYREL